MKHTLLFIFSCLALNFAEAQALEFTYDEAGNQVRRELVTISFSSLLTTNSTDTVEKEQDTMLPQSNSLNSNSTMIELYPNPVVDLLNVEWTADLQLTEIMLFDNLGKMLQLKKIHEGTVRETFHFSTYAPGIYYIRVFDALGQSKSFKVIKK